MYRLEGVNKLYRRNGAEVVAFRAESLEIADGEHVAVVGPSGSGKTTLLSMLGGMLAPSAGRVRLDDVSLYEVGVVERAQVRQRRIGFVFQTFNLIPYLTAIENVQVPLMLMELSSAQQQDRAAEVLESVGLGARLHHKPSEMSTGQQQRVALARTMANAPSIILADEPTGNLDPESREQVLGYLQGFCREGRTVIVVTHDPNVAARADRTLHIADGTVDRDSGLRVRHAA